MAEKEVGTIFHFVCKIYICTLYQCTCKTHIRIRKSFALIFAKTIVKINAEAPWLGMRMRICIRNSPDTYICMLCYARMCVVACLYGCMIAISYSRSASQLGLCCRVYVCVFVCLCAFVCSLRTGLGLESNRNFAAVVVA